MSEETTGSGDRADREPRPVPDLGFFGGPPPAQSQFGGPPPAQSQFGGPPPAQSQFGGASAYETPSRFGGATATPFGGAPQPQFGGPAPTQFGSAPFGYPPAAPPAAPRTGLPPWAVKVLVGVGALFVLAVVAAVAVPTYESMHAKSLADRTTISTPPQIGDFTQATEPAALNAAQQFKTQMMSDESGAQLKQVEAAIYQSGGVRALVIAGRPKAAMTGDGQSKFQQGFIDGFERSSGIPPVMSPVVKASLSGLGGLFSCAQVEAGNTTDVLCLATDAGAFEVILLSGVDYNQATDMAISLREGVEHRSS